MLYITHEKSAGAEPPFRDILISARQIVIIEEELTS